MENRVLPAALATRAARRGRRRCGGAGRRCGDAAGRGRRGSETTWSRASGIDRDDDLDRPGEYGGTAVGGLGHRHGAGGRAGRDECRRRRVFAGLECHAPEREGSPPLHRVHRRLRLRAGTWDRRGGDRRLGRQLGLSVFYGSGGIGVLGNGYGIESNANAASGSDRCPGVGPNEAQVALKVTGKVSLSRSGRVAMSSEGQSQGRSRYGRHHNQQGLRRPLDQRIRSLGARGRSGAGQVHDLPQRGTDLVGGSMMVRARLTGTTWDPRLKTRQDRPRRNGDARDHRLWRHRERLGPIADQRGLWSTSLRFDVKYLRASNVAARRPID